MRDTIFYRQAELLLRFLPIIHDECIFAIKGGTALNFFVRDLPRLSVDIDLTYLPMQERNTSLEDISSGLSRISEKIKKMIPDIVIVRAGIFKAAKKTIDHPDHINKKGTT